MSNEFAAMMRRSRVLRLLSYFVRNILLVQRPTNEPEIRKLEKEGARLHSWTQFPDILLVERGTLSLQMASAMVQKY